MSIIDAFKRIPEVIRDAAIEHDCEVIGFAFILTDGKVEVRLDDGMRPEGGGR